MRKKDMLEKASPKQLANALKCGDCLHHKKYPHAGKKSLCKDMGVKAFSPAPPCYTPDITQIATNVDTFAQVAMLMSSFSSKERRILFALLKTKSKKKQFSLGTKVYFHAFGKDYISNYLSGYAAGYTSSGQLIVIGSPDRNTRGKAYVLYCDSTDHLMLLAQWKFKKRELQQAGKRFDPKPMFDKKVKLTDSDEPPTIDSAPPEWHSKMEKNRKKKSKAYAKPLTDTFRIS